MCTFVSQIHITYSKHVDCMWVLRKLCEPVEVTSFSFQIGNVPAVTDIQRNLILTSWAGLSSLLLLDSSCSSTVWHCDPLKFNNYLPVITILEDLRLAVRVSGLAVNLTVWGRRINEKPEGIGLTDRMTVITKWITIQKEPG